MSDQQAYADAINIAENFSKNPPEENDDEPEMGEPEPATKLLGKLRLGSVKPFWITTRDALIVSVITVLITVIMYIFIFLFTGSLSSMVSMSFAGTLFKSFAIAMSLQYAYEYVGVNAMLCESASRYYTDQALSKYTTRAHALTDSASIDNAWAVINNSTAKDDPILKEIQKNQKKFHAMVRSTQDAYKIAQYLQDEIKKGNRPTPEVVYNKFLASKVDKAKLKLRELRLIMNLVDNSYAPGSNEYNILYDRNANRLEAVPRLIEVMGRINKEKVINHFMKSGFELLKSTGGKKPTLDTQILFENGLISQADKAISDKAKDLFKGFKMFGAVR